jgi:hypothetical protein
MVHRPALGQRSKGPINRLENMKTKAKTAKPATAIAAAVSEAASVVEQSAPPVQPVPAPLSRKEKRDAWRTAQAEVRAMLAPVLDTPAANDATGTRKSGEAMIAAEAHALLSLAIPAGKADVRDWPLKGGGTAFQVSGPIAPIEGAATERERALAAAVNSMLAPFAGFRLRVVRYTGKRGVSYSASLALAGR